jgi:hypothetical protein
MSKSQTREEIQEERRKLKAQYGQLFEATSALLFRHDPAGINYETNTDEYESEVGTILPRLKTCQSAEDVQKVIHEEFVRWFDTSSAGPKEHYIKISKEIWQLWRQFQK